MQHSPRLALLALLAAACGDDGAVTTDTGGQTSSTGPATTTGAPTTGDPPPGTTTTTSGGTIDASTTGPTPTTEQASVTDSSDTGTSTTGTSTSTTTDTSTSTSSSSSDTSTSSSSDTSTSSSDTSDTSSSETTGTSTTTGTTADDTSSSTGDTTTGDPPIDLLGYAGVSFTDQLVIFDPATDQLVGAPIDLLPEGDYPYDAVIKPDGSELWIVGATGDGVKVIDIATNTIVQQIDLTGIGEYPIDVLFSADSARAIVSSRDNEALVLIDAATYTVTDTIALPANTDGGKMTLDPCTGLVHFVEWYGNTLIRFDPVSEAVTGIPLGVNLWDARVDPAGTTLYVLDRGLDQVHVLDVATLAVLAAVPVGNDPWALDITSDGQLVVVACEDDSSVHFIETAGLTTTSLALPPGADPRDVDISLDDATAYVATGDIQGADGVYKIDLATRTLTGTISFGFNANTNVVTVAPQSVTCTP